MRLDKYYITLQPSSYLFKANEKYDVKYIENVVMIEIYGQKNNIESQELYEWLKNDEFKSEFTTQLSE